jgi:hypothetical protein
MSQKIAHILFDFAGAKSVCGAEEKQRHGRESLGNHDQGSSERDEQPTR